LQISGIRESYRANSGRLSMPVEHIGFLTAIETGGLLFIYLDPGAKSLSMCLDKMEQVSFSASQT